ncbi:ATP synthase F0 subunit C [bacterium]|nr:ATP synthase F0 subunit C [bacterium]
MDMGLVWIAVASVLGASFAVGFGGLGPALAEGGAVKQTLASMAQQPDEASSLRSTLFVSLAMLESTAIYALLVGMILIFSNPFWNYGVAQLAK